MEESAEDIAILEEIRLLEDALARESPPPLIISASPEPPESPVEEEPENIADILPTSTPQEALIHSAFKLNEALLAKYMVLESKIKERLQEIQTERAEISSKMKSVSKEVKGPVRVDYRRFLCPYFKDESFFSAPLNQDALLKIQRGELMVVYLKPPSRWTTKDRNLLWKAVRLEAATEYFEKETRKQLRKSDEKRGKQSSKSQVMDNLQEIDLDIDKCQLPKNYREMIGSLGSREFDWMKISAHTFNHRHSADECRVMWNVYLHPDINRYKFTGTEDRHLISAAEANGLQDWDAIAEQIGTGRSGYQCFIRYTTIVGPINLRNKDEPWTPREDKILMKVVEHLRIGNYIPWSQVTFYIDNRTKNQVYSHWKYSMDPSLRKGRFTAEEDQLILDGVTKYGRDFARIAIEMLPHRTSVQLSGRFTLLILKTDQSYNSWTVAEDMQLLKLHEEFGAQWSKIARLMNKNRTYLRHRYSSIGKHLAKGRKLSTMSRKLKGSKGDEAVDSTFEEAFILDQGKIQDDDIGTRLKRYFERVRAPISTPGRKKKYMDARELQTATKELYNLFQVLNVQLNIPEDLKLEGLTPKDQQLLTSFKNYTLGKGSNVRDVESVRRRMFGDCNKGDYIAPAPFGLTFKLGPKNRKRKLIESINEDCDVILDYNIVLPDNVEKMLTDEERKGFEKIMGIVSKCKDPEEVDRKVLSVECEESHLVTDAGITSVSWGRKVGEMSAKYNEEEKMFVEPSCATLWGYEGLRHMKDTNGSLPWTRDEKALSKAPVSEAGKRAFHIFKSRFMKLFKYPIGLMKYGEMKKENTSGRPPAPPKDEEDT